MGSWSWGLSWQFVIHSVEACIRKKTMNKLCWEMFGFRVGAFLFWADKMFSEALAVWVGSTGREKICYGLIIEVLPTRYYFQRRLSANTFLLFFPGRCSGTFIFLFIELLCVSEWGDCSWAESAEGSPSLIPEHSGKQEPSGCQERKRRRSSFLFCFKDFELIVKIILT